jgi:hypothetical protein
VIEVKTNFCPDRAFYYPRTIPPSGFHYRVNQKAKPRAFGRAIVE